MKLKNKKNIYILLFTLFLSLFHVLSSFALILTSDYKYDNISYKLGQSNNFNFNDKYFCNILRLSSEKLTISEVNVLYKHYNNDYSVLGKREIIADDIYLPEINETVQLITLPTLSINNLGPNKDKYVVDGGNFELHFPTSILGPGREYLTTRFGCDTFGYISDTLASKLLSLRKLEDYKELMVDEKFSIVEFDINKSSNVKVSINNIIKTDSLEGSRVKSIYDNFVVVYLPERILNKFDIGFEMDIQTNPYIIKNILYDTKKFMHPDDDSFYKILTYNNLNKKYSINDSLSEDVNSLASSKYSNALGWIIYSLTIIIFLVVLIYINIKDIDIKNFYIHTLVITVVYSFVMAIVQTFTYTYTFTNLFLLLMWITELCLYKKNFLNSFNYFLRLLKIKGGDKIYVKEEQIKL